MSKTLKEKLIEERKEIVDLLAVRIKSFIDTKEECLLERTRCGCTEVMWLINAVINPPKTPRKLRAYPSEEILDEIADRLSAKLGFRVVLCNIGDDVWLKLNWSSKYIS